MRVFWTALARVVRSELSKGAILVRLRWPFEPLYSEAAGYYEGLITRGCMLEEALLILKLKSGDREALRQIYARHKDALYSIAACLLGDAQHAKGLLQDVFIDFAGRIKSFPVYGDLNRYFLISLVDHARDRLRSQMYQVVGLESTGPITAGAEREQATAELDDRLQQLTQSLMKLLLREREVIVLEMVGRLRLRQVAGILNVSVSVAESRYQAGLEKLQASFGTIAQSDIEELMGRLRRSTAKQLDQRIFDRTYAALREALKTGPSAGVPVTRLTTIAVMIIATAIIVTFFVGTIKKRRPVGLQELPEQKVVTDKTDMAEPSDRQFVPGLEQVKTLAAAKDIDGLIEVLSTGDRESRLVAVIYLAKLGDAETIKKLERLSKQFGQAGPDNLFEVAIAAIDQRLRQQGRRAAKAEIAKSAERARHIEGWLVDANDEAVTGEVVLGGVKIVTDQEGVFSLPRPRRQQFGWAMSSEAGLGAFFFWPKDSDEEVLEIVVKPLASVSGSVIDRDGEPVDDFKLQVTLFKDSVHTRELTQPPFNVEVSDAGVFEISSVPTGVGLKLLFTMPGFRTEVKSDKLPAGKNLDLGQITLEPLPGSERVKGWDCSVSGFFLDEANEPIAGVKVTADVGEKRFVAAGDQSGRYELAGLPKDMKIVLSCYLDGYGSNRFDYTCFEPNSVLDIQMFPPAFDWYGKEPPPLFVAKWLNTEPVKLDDLAGTVVLLHIGADSGASPEQIELLKDVYDKYKDEGFTVVVIHRHVAEQPAMDAVEQFVREGGFDFAFGIDNDPNAVEDMLLPKKRSWQQGRILVPRKGLQPAGATASLYEVKTEPGYYLIDKNGLLRVAPTDSNLADWIEELLGE